jgi:hypothetical protein
MPEEFILLADHYDDNKNKVIARLTQGFESATTGRFVGLSFSHIQEDTEINADALEATLIKMAEDDIVVRVGTGSYPMIQDEFTLTKPHRPQ